ncbi:MAG: hypothetical protein KFF73_11230, partial [Cyclobacteriaceae bacterium]|nr:hypothetical protein [Cyclobacteriaceae bacterium]
GGRWFPGIYAGFSSVIRSRSGKKRRRKKKEGKRSRDPVLVPSGGIRKGIRQTTGGGQTKVGHEDADANSGGNIYIKSFIFFKFHNN